MMQFYVEPTNISKDEFTQTIASGSIESKCDAIVRATYFIPDYDWLLTRQLNILRIN